MAMLHGVVYGDDLEQGIISGRDFIHPLLKFRFTVPEGFRLINNLNSVVATNLEGSSIQFDMGPKTYNGPMARYLKNVWAPKARLDDVESIMVNGMDGAVGGATIQRRGGGCRR
jgi:predicted Zn-dependent protease